MTLTIDRTYHFPVKPRVKIYSQDGSTLYHTWDGFSGSNPFKLVYIDAEDAVGESGTFNLIIDDLEGALDTSLLRNVEVHIEFGKTSAYQNGYYLIGPARVFDTRRPRTGAQEYLVSGFGDWIKSAELLLLIRQAAKSGSTDSQYNINRQMEDSIKKKKYRPLNREPIEDVTNWLTDGISSEVNINYPVINEVFTTLWDFAERNSALSGAPVYMDFSEGTKNIVMKYLTSLHTGVIVKSADLRLASDDAAKISYIKDAFHIEDNSSIDAGTATRLYTSTVIDQSVVASQEVNHGSIDLNNRAIAQQIEITNDARRIDACEFTMFKVGEPESPKDRVNGDIVLDNGSDKPTGTVLDTFSIPLSSLETTPKTVEVTDLDVSAKLLEGGSKKIWVRFFQRSGITGNPINDSANTVKVCHNGVFSTAQPLYFATAPEGDTKKKSSLVWSSNNQGPMMCFKLKSNIRRLQARTNQTSKRIVGLIERYIDTSWMQDPTIVNRFLSLVLAQTSKARRVIPDIRVTNPNDFLFRKYQGVTFMDGLSGVQQDLQIMRSRYVISALPGDPQVGTFHCDITLGGLFNSLLASCGCG